MVHRHVDLVFELRLVVGLAEAEQIELRSRRKVRAQLARGDGKLGAVHARHGEACDHQVDVLASGQVAQRSLSGIHLQHLLAEILLHLDAVHGDQQIVIDHEDAGEPRRIAMSSNPDDRPWRCSRKAERPGDSAVRDTDRD